MTAEQLQETRAPGPEMAGIHTYLLNTLVLEGVSPEKIDKQDGIRIPSVLHMMYWLSLIHI